MVLNLVVVYAAAAADPSAPAPAASLRIGGSPRGPASLCAVVPGLGRRQLYFGRHLSQDAGQHLSV
jgi:hypothetical protein